MNLMERGGYIPPLSQCRDHGITSLLGYQSSYKYWTRGVIDVDLEFTPRQPARPWQSLVKPNQL